MGRYINSNSNGEHIGTSFEQKVQALVKDGAEKITTPSEFKEGLVCVVDNGMFAAAAYAYDEGEFKVFLLPDGRRRQWLYMANAEQLAT